MTTVGAIIAGVAGVLLVILTLIKKVATGSKETGKVEATLEAQKEISQQAVEQRDEQIESVKETNVIHDRLESDPEYADRVRDRFTRD